MRLRGAHSSKLIAKFTHPPSLILSSPVVINSRLLRINLGLKPLFNQSFREAVKSQSYHQVQRGERKNVSRSQNRRSAIFCIMRYFFPSILISLNIKFTYVILTNLSRLIRRKINSFCYMIYSVYTLA